MVDVIPERSVAGGFDDAVQPRRLAPTERQLALEEFLPEHAAVGVDDRIGVPGVDHAPEVATGAELTFQRRSLGRGVRALGRNLDFRGLPPEVPRLPLFVLAFGAALGGWEGQALGLIGPELRTEFGLTLTTLTSLNSMTSTFALLCAIPMGYLVDRVRRVYFVRAAGILHQLSVLLQIFSRTTGGYIGSRLVGTAGGIVGGPAQGPLVADYFPPHTRARVFTLLGVYGTVGGLVGLPIAGLLVTRYGWRPATLALSVPAVIAALGSFFLKEPKRGEVDRLSYGATAEHAADEPPPVSLVTAMRAAWSIRTVRRLAFAQVVVGIGYGTIAITLTLYLAEKFLLSPFQRSIVGWITLLCTLPTLLYAGKVADRLLAYKPQRVLVLQGCMLFLSAANLLVVALVPNLILSIVLTTINAVILALLGPATTTLYSLLIPAQVRGVGMQVYAPFQLIGLVTGPILVGIVARAEMAQIIIMFTPVYAIGAVMTLSAASTVERDLRAARAANLADSESQRAKTSGINKMLVVRDVDVEYNGVKVLFHVDLDIEEGETLALLGTNGAGKSTLLRAIAGVHEASNGAIFLDGADITHAPAHENAARGVVMMPGGRAVFPSLTVAENLRSATWTLRDGDDDVDARIEQVLEFFPRLRERMDQQAGKLSGGEQQMVALGQAFLMKPRLLMIDELSLGLAPAVVDLLIDILRRIRDQGTTIVVVEQSINVALTIAERAVFMEKGEILFDGPTEGLLGRPDLVRSVFMGRAVAGRAAGGRRSSSEPETALAVRDVAIAFGGVQALEGVSLDLAPGEILGIIGPNGAGKTTLFDVISGYLPPDAGSITLEGSDVTGMGADARARLGIGRSFQSATLFPSLTVRETITVAYERRAVKSAVLGALWTPKVRKSEAKLRSRVDGLVELLGLEAYADKFVRELSTGTRRAVDIACIMASQPKVLLLDEPSSGLAQAESEALGPALTRVVRDTGCGVILIEHDMPLITSVSDRLMAIELGHVLATGTPTEVTSDKRVIESYLTASTDVLQRSGSRVGEAVAQLRASLDDTDDPAK